MVKTLLLVTHDPELARRAHRNIHVVDGVVIDSPPYERREPMQTPDYDAAGIAG